jgi:decaprenyl-phosphate phosphoribosyltransferase
MTLAAVVNRERREAPEDPSRPAPTCARRRPVVAYLELARPRQWVKNLLVVVAPLAAGVIGRTGTLLHVAAALGVFCMAAAGTYAVNDALDAPADRVHPQKRSRPVAGGEIAPVAATMAGLLWLGLALLGAGFLGWKFGAVVGAYVAITLGYSRWWKHEAVVDLMCVSAGFVLRAVGGGVATGVALSNWFLLVTSLGALLVVCGKRSAEQAELGTLESDHRPALGSYPAAFLQSARLVALAGTLFAYCLWTFERTAHVQRGVHSIWFQLTVVPVLFVLLRLELLFQQGKGSAPEELALGDRALQLAGIAWTVLFVLGVYG